MNEQLIELITKTVREVIEEKKINSNGKYVPVGVSARHIHLSKEDLEKLFGQGYELTKKKDLMGGQYAAEETVTLIGSKLTTMEKVRILGPVRKNTQVEISKTDSIKLGLKPPIRESGNIKGSEAITIAGPKGAIHLEEGCIIAKRHIHMSPLDAKKYGIIDNDVVSVKIPGERGGIMSNVQVRVHETYSLEMHIDTDEANALDIKCGEKLQMAL